MAKNAPKPSVSVTPGKNKPVNNVIKFEDLVQQLKQGAPAAASKKAGVKAAHREQLTAIQQLATDLETRLRAVRRATPDQPTPARAAKRKRKA
jgi:hypothetical protein